MQTRIERVRSAFDSIELNLKSILICSNMNRVGILCLLKNTPGNELRAEKIASSLGISHRTVLYHLDILHDYDVVEVREFRKKGSKFLRSVWGLNSREKNNINKIFSNIKKRFGTNDLDEILNGTNGNGK